MKEYIHYGQNSFDLHVFFEGAKNTWIGRDKPPFGFWASPVDAHWGWKDWCESEEFRLDRLKESFKFTLHNNARILYVNSLDDIEDYVYLEDGENPEYSWNWKMDFRKIMEEYDGMELDHTGHYTELHDSLFYTWDCDSIVIWNPSIIIPF